MKVAYIHDWLDSYRGGERVLEALIEFFPDAPIYTLFYRPEAMPPSIRNRNVIYPKWLSPLMPWRKMLLPILPHVVESFATEQYDLIISSSSCVAKGVMLNPNAKHICYIHSPMRYVWDQRRHYTDHLPKVAKAAIHWAATGLRLWDQVSNSRVDRFVANSHFVAKRVERYYNRQSGVIAPPVSVDIFHGAATPSDYFLIAGAFVPYKRFDLAIKACERARVRLIVAGSGSEEASLRKTAGPNTEFVISPDQNQWVSLFQGARGFLFPGVEDFGITAIEAMAAGCPVIAFKEGGALDYVEDGVTGTFFADQTEQCLANVIEKFQASDYDRKRIQSFANKFSKEMFLRSFRHEINKLVGEFAS